MKIEVIAIINRFYLFLIILLIIVGSIFIYNTSDTEIQKLKSNPKYSSCTTKELKTELIFNTIDLIHDFRKVILGLSVFIVLVIVSIEHTKMFKKLGLYFPSNYSITKKEIKETNTINVIPFNCNIPASYHILNKTNSISNTANIVYAYILKFVLEDKISIKKTIPDFTISNKVESCLTFSNKTDDMTNIEKELYLNLMKASGTDNILNQYELKRWINNNKKLWSNWLKKVDLEAINYLKSNNFLRINQKKNPLNFFILSEYDLTVLGKIEALNLIGFKNYIEKSTLVDEREAIETKLWDNYLIFAALFGLSDKVYSQLKVDYPELYELINIDYSDCIIGDNTDFASTLEKLYHMKK